ncbi:MAG: ATP-binding cassette domain-containing protein [Candidatus Binatia bacterium]
MSPVLALRGLAKRFGNVMALAGVDLDLRCGEVHAVLGENGAGKSTLMKVVYGLVTPDAGALAVDGRPRRFASPLDARRAGIGMVHQELSLVDALTVAENLALSLSPPGEWRWRRARVGAAASRLAQRIGLELGDLDAPVGALPVGQRQRIEIVKALAGETRVLILDEPTAVLTPSEATLLFDVLGRLRAAGTAVLFITHKLGEVMAIADRVTVMRQGRVVACAERAAVDQAELARLMVGELTVAGDGGGATDAAPVQLRVAGLCAPGRPALEAIDLTVRAGEIVGIAGVDGNGQEELFEVLTGLRAPARGRIEVGGAPLPPASRRPSSPPASVACRPTGCGRASSPTCRSPTTPCSTSACCAPAAILLAPAALAADRAGDGRRLRHQGRRPRRAGARAVEAATCRS